MSLIFCGIFIFPFQINAQKPTEADYERALSFMRDSLFVKIYHLGVSPVWFEDRSGFLYKTHTRKGDFYYKVNPEKQKKEPAFDHEELAKSLSEILGEKVEPGKLSLERLTAKNGDEISFFAKGKRYGYKSGRLEAEESRPSRFNRNEILSPDKSQAVFIKNANLFIKYHQTGEEKALTQGGNDYYIYGSTYGWDQLMEGENTPPKPNLSVRWSPDGKKIYTQVMDARDAQKMYLLDYSADSLYRARLFSYYRGSPGDTTIVKYLPLVIDVETGKNTFIDLPPIAHFMGFGLTWSRDSDYLYGMYQHRGYKQMDVIEVNPETGKIRIVAGDSIDTHIKYALSFRYLEEPGIALFTSERTGWNQLYSVDWLTGKTTHFAAGEYVFDQIKSVDIKNKIIYFSASGREPGANPYHKQLYKVNFDGSGLKLLTYPNLNHEVIISPDHKYFIDMASDINTPTLSYLRSVEDGRNLLDLEKADIADLAQKGWKPPTLEKLISRDGKTEIYAAIWKPTHFDPTKKYPVIDFSYTGPHTQVVPHDFAKVAWPYSYADVQALAELGFIILNIDGIGSVGRSKAFQDVSYRNMGDNLKDHVVAIRKLGKKYSWMDTTRVGIFGHSAGGYDAAHAVLTLNDTYKVSVSEAADHDWRMEKAWWPEMYAGWPIERQYEEQSNITLAPNLKGKLLLIHGGMDSNVNPSATFKLAENLIKAGKYFDMFIIPSSNHAIPKEYDRYIARMRWDYFVEHLIVNFKD